MLIREYSRMLVKMLRKISSYNNLRENISGIRLHQMQLTFLLWAHVLEKILIVGNKFLVFFLLNNSKFIAYTLTLKLSKVNSVLDLESLKNGEKMSNIVEIQIMMDRQVSGQSQSLKHLVFVVKELRFMIGINSQSIKKEKWYR